MDVDRRFLEALNTLTHSKQLCVAYSGGLDSRVLLALVVERFSQDPDYQISALHIDHGISEHRKAWIQHCEDVCATLEVPLTVLRVNGRVTGGRSPEEVAREARFSAFREFLTKGQVLLLAHHEDDQAETILLRLFRGSGPLGLGGIAEKAILGKGELIRPLLKVSKEAMVEYAKEKDLSWVEDDSNTNVRFDRNFLRSEIMPKLMARWPRVTRSISRAGALCVETATALDAFAKKDLESVNREQNETLCVSRLLALDKIRRRGVIRCWLQERGLSFPSLDHMERIDREVLKAKPGSKPRLKISDYEVRRIKDELQIHKLEVLLEK